MNNIYIKSGNLIKYISFVAEANEFYELDIRGIFFERQNYTVEYNDPVMINVTLHNFDFEDDMIELESDKGTVIDQAKIIPSGSSNFFQIHLIPERPDFDILHLTTNGAEELKYDLLLNVEWPGIPLIGSYAEISLTQGWNLISLPLVPSSNYIENILFNLSYQTVRKWDKEAGTWRSYLYGFGGDVYELNPGEGFWINVGENQTLNIPGSSFEPDFINLSSGWNLIGHNNNMEFIDTALTNVSYQTVRRWNKESETWDSYTHGFGGDFEVFNPGEGYWVYIP